jgi:hypothetical protein
MTRVYHFTHQGNLGSILKAGGLKCDADISPQRYSNSGNRDIKARRGYMPVSASPHGVVSDYVPFYFAPRSPMLYSIHAGNVPDCTHPQTEIIYLCADLEDIITDNQCCFTDRNAAKITARFYDDFTELNKIVDWPLMKETYWRNTPDDLERVERRMAEFLVHKFCPWDTIKGIGVFGKSSLSYVEEVLTANGTTTSVSIEPSWYF